MEVSLALHGTASQARIFILLEVVHRFEEEVALDSACGGVCTWASLMVTARRAPYEILRVAARASLRAARRASRTSPRPARVALCCAEEERTSYCALGPVARCSLFGEDLFPL